MQQKLAQKENAAKEENLRLLAQRAREEHAGIAPSESLQLTCLLHPPAPTPAPPRPLRQPRRNQARPHHALGLRQRATQSPRWRSG
jgi:hypothetical protein